MGQGGRQRIQQETMELLAEIVIEDRPILTA
jgi:hypothetical protein